MENYGTNWSPTFSKNQDPSPWIREQRDIKMLVRHYKKNPDRCGCLEKLQKNTLNLQLFSNPGDKVLILSQDLTTTTSTRFDTIKATTLRESIKSKKSLSFVPPPSVLDIHEVTFVLADL